MPILNDIVYSFTVDPRKVKALEEQDAKQNAWQLTSETRYMNNIESFVEKTQMR